MLNDFPVGLILALNHMFFWKKTILGSSMYIFIERMLQLPSITRTIIVDKVGQLSVKCNIFS